MLGFDSIVDNFVSFEANPNRKSDDEGSVIGIVRMNEQTNTEIPRIMTFSKSSIRNDRL